jgi:hypothetical protein
VLCPHSLGFAMPFSRLNGRGIGDMHLSQPSALGDTICLLAESLPHSLDVAMRQQKDP